MKTREKWNVKDVESLSFVLLTVAAAVDKISCNATMASIYTGDNNDGYMCH